MTTLYSFFSIAIYVFFLVALWLCYRRKIKQVHCLTAILVLGLFLRIATAQDPFLHTWDERFHALVAKNLIEHPLKPVLYAQPVLPYDFREWSNNHIWLSKPPLALWPMAASIHWFGTNEIAVRLPSILFSTLSILLTFFIGRRLFGAWPGLLAACLHAMHGRLIEVASGRLSSDHVETLFLFFLEWAMLLTVKYYQRAKRPATLALGIGLLTGLAFLCKWIAALFVPILWLAIGLWMRRPVWELLKHGMVIALSASAVAAPWLFFMLYAYPEEATYLLRAVLLPVSETIQGHQGHWYYFLDQARLYYGELIYLPMLWLVFVIWRKPKRFSILVITLWIALPMLLLSLMETKRSTYLLLTAPGFFLLTALCFYLLTVKRPEKRSIRILARLTAALLVLLPLRYSIERVKPFANFAEERQWTEELKALSSAIPLPPKQVVLFSEPHPIQAMFYTGFTAYPWIPEASMLEELRAKGYRIFVKKETGYEEYR